jgi:signal transduction histidine kinase
MVIDNMFVPRPVFKVHYYLINGLGGIAALGLILWPPCRTRLGRWFLPLIIVLMSAVPIVSGNVAVLRTPYQPAGSPESVMLRQLPMVLLPLVLTAWRYRWRHVVIFTLAMVGVRQGVQLFFRPEGTPFMPSGGTFTIQVISFLLAGYFICNLMSRLREQNKTLEEANAQLLNYANTLEHLAMSRERNRLARELHDTLAHTLTGLSVQLEAAKAYFEVDTDAAGKLIDRALQTTRSGLVETRLALKSLRAGPLDDLGLQLALRTMAEEAATRARLHLHLSLPEQIEPLSPDVEQAVYRVAQEAVANVVNHACATNLTMHLSLHYGRLLLTVRDDGNGFDVEQRDAADRYGLAGMKERAHLAGGCLTVNSHIGQGTTISLAI